MVMGFQNYSSLPRHLRGMLGLSPELDPATYSGASRTQVCAAMRSICSYADTMLWPDFVPALCLQDIWSCNIDVLLQLNSSVGSATL